MTMWKWLALFALAPVLANARVTILNGVNIGGGVSVSNSSAPPAPPPSSPFALVAHTTSVASQNTVTTPAIDTSTANICIVKPSWAVSSTSITCAANISDSKSNTWLTASAPVGSTTGSGICYAAPCTTGAGHTFTFTKTAASLFGSIQVAAFKGAGTISLAANDVSSANSGGASVTTLQAGGVSPQHNFMLSIAGVTSTQTGTLTVNGPFSANITDKLPWDGTNGGGGALAYNIQTAATGDNPTWTGTSGIMAASQAVFISSAVLQAPVATTSPCDALASGCQEAWSLTRTMRAAYVGPLFQIAKNSDRSTLDIGQTGGVVDMSAASAFCGGTLSNCHIVQIYPNVNAANPLHYSTLGNGGDVNRPDCTVPAVPTRPPCAAPLALGATTGLPEIATNILGGPPRFGYQYLIGTGTDGNSTGIVSGGADRTLVEIGQFQPGNGACCGNWGPSAHTLGVNGSSFLIALGFGDPGPGVLECNGNSYCATIDCEAGAGCNATGFPPSPLYSINLPTNSNLVIAKYNSATRQNSISFNAANYYSVTAGVGYMATGTKWSLGGGGDLTTPAPVKFWEGFITNAVASAGDETTLLANVKAFYPMATFP